MKKTDKRDELNPGSPAAVKAGCSCPVMDNDHGKGCGVTHNGHKMFWTNGDCKIHGTRCEPPGGEAS